MTRREVLPALGGAALLAARVAAQAPTRTTPALCVYSQNLIKVFYSELGNIAQQIGYDGVDLTVTVGGHVDPHATSVDLVRAFESVQGAGLELPMITTNITSPLDPTAYPILYLTGHSQIPLFRLGFWPYGETPIPQRLALVRRDLVQILGLAQRCGMAAMFPNRAGAFVGEAVWDTQTIIGDLDPRWVGYSFDPSQAVAEGGLGGWEAALRLTLPRLKAITLQDFYWKKDGADWKMQMCPLGEGMVDWQKFFSIVAAARFAGPISLRMDYPAPDEPGAMSKDLQFARARVGEAWKIKPA